MFDAVEQQCVAAHYDCCSPSAKGEILPFDQCSDSVCVKARDEIKLARALFKHAKLFMAGDEDEAQLTNVIDALEAMSTREHRQSIAP